MLHQRVRREIPTAGRPGGRPPEARAELREVARLASRLTPYSGDPERFYLHREEVVSRIHALADTLEGAR